MQFIQSTVLRICLKQTNNQGAISNRLDMLNASDSDQYKTMVEHWIGKFCNSVSIEFNELQKTSHRLMTISFSFLLCSK